MLAACSPEYNPPLEPGVKTSIQETSTPSKALPTATIKLTETPTPVQIESIEVDPKKLQDERVIFWHSWSDGIREAVDEIVFDFNENNEWGIEVEAIYQGNPDFIDKQVKGALGSGEVPDVVIGYLHQAQEWNEAAALVDQKIFVDDPVWGFSVEEQEDFYRVFWEHDVVDGKRFGIPVQRYGQILLYNKSWAQELGFESHPKSPDEFKDQACAAYYANLLDEDEENDGSGGWIVSTDYATMLGWIYAFQGQILYSGDPEEDERYYEFDTPQNEAAFRFLKNLYDDGCAWLPASQVPEEEFVSRQGLFTNAHVGDLKHLREAFRAQGNYDTWTAIPFPSPEETPAYDVFGPSLFLFSPTLEKQLASWLFIKWLTGPEQQAKIIKAAGTLPVRESSLEYLQEYKNQNPQWSQAVSALPYAKAEPGNPSWKNVRWALGDASRQLFLSYFTIENVPDLLKFLDQTAHALHLGPVKSGLLDTPTPTPTITPTASKTPTVTNTQRVTPTGTLAASSTTTYTPVMSQTP
jgi:ABC-type glycerol-3-phosphate transport system substrate-binding protein